MCRTPLFAALSAVALVALAKAEDPGFPAALHTVLRVGNPQATIPPTGTWRLESDRALDGELHATPSAKQNRSQVAVLESANGQLVGRFRANVEKEMENGAMFTGSIVAGSPALVTLREDGPPGHTALYVGRLVSETQIAGTFVDNRGFAGDWSLTLVTETTIEPLAKEVTGEFFESVLGVYGKAIRGVRQPFINLRPPHRNLWTDEIKEVVEGTLSYGEVDYIGTAKIVIPESGTYTVDLPGAGVQFRINGQSVEAGDMELEKGLYEIEIYTNHWGQPYLTYAEAAVYKKGSEVRIPFVNTAADIEIFRSQKIEGRPAVEVCEYSPQRIVPE